MNRFPSLTLAACLILPARAAHGQLEQIPARSAFAEGNFGDAAKRFGALKEKRPEDLGLSYQEGVANFMAGEYGRAKENFEAAGQSADPTQAAQSLYNLGNTEVALGNIDAAIKAYEKVLEIEPQNKEAAENLAWAKQQQQQQKKQEKQEGQEGQEQQQGKGQDHRPQDERKDSKDQGREPPQSDSDPDSASTQHDKPDANRGQATESPGKTTPDEAQRMLDSVEDQVKKYLYRPPQSPDSKAPPSNKEPDRDW